VIPYEGHTSSGLDQHTYHSVTNDVIQENSDHVTSFQTRAPTASAEPVYTAVNKKKKKKTSPEGSGDVQSFYANVPGELSTQGPTQQVRSKPLRYDTVRSK